MYQIQYDEKGRSETIDIIYFELEDAVRDAQIFKRGCPKRVLNTKTGVVVWTPRIF